MGKAICIIAIIAALSSCSAVGFLETQRDEFLDARNYTQAEKISLYYGDFTEIGRIENIDEWIGERVSYRADFGDSWQTPEETLKTGYGDCEDFALLFINIAFVRFGIKCELVGVTINESRTVEEGGVYDHFMVRLPSGKIIEPQNGYTRFRTVQYSYTFDELFGDDK